MCSAPSPWHVAQVSFETTPFTTAPRACGLVTKLFPCCSWQSEHDGGASSARTVTARTRSSTKPYRFIARSCLFRVHLVDSPVLPCPMTRRTRLGRRRGAGECHGVEECVRGRVLA